MNKSNNSKLEKFKLDVAHFVETKSHDQQEIKSGEDLLKDIRLAGKYEPSPIEREKLAQLARTLGGHLFETTGTYRPVRLEQYDYRNESISPPTLIPHKDWKTFINRHAEIDLFTRELKNGVNIFVISGMGGVGKTSLAIHLASQFRDQFPDGILWAELSENANVSSILGVFAKAYDQDISNFEDIQSRSLLVREILANKKALIILDSVDHSEHLFHFIPSEGESSVIITTRNHNIAGYVNGVSLKLHPLNIDDGIKLVTSILGNTLSPDDYRITREIVEILGGFPLALRIASSALNQKDHLTMADYRDLLKDESSRLVTLDSMAQSHRNIWTTFELSYNLLSEELTEIFTSLAVFDSNEFSIEAVSFILNKPIIRTKLMLKQIHALSLISLAGSVDGDGVQEISGRYYLNSLLKVYLLEKGKHFLDEVRKRATDYYLEFTRNNSLNFSAIELEYKNIEGLMAWATANQDHVWLEKIVHSLSVINLGSFGFLDVEGHWAFAIKHLEHIHRNLQSKDPKSEASILLRLGAFNLRLGNLQQARQYLENCLEILVHVNPMPQSILLKAYTYDTLSQLYTEENLDQALELSKLGLSELEKLNEASIKYEEGYMLIRHSTALARSGDISKAKKLAQKGLNILNDKLSAARISANMTLGGLAFFEGNPEDAFRHWSNGILDAEMLGDKRRLAGLWSNLGMIESYKGSHFQAIEYYETAISLHRQIGNLNGEIDALSNLSYDYMLLGDFDKASSNIQLAIKKANKLNLQWSEASARANFALIQIYFNEVSSAKSELALAKKISQLINDIQLYSEVIRLEALLLFADKKYAEAKDLVEESIKKNTDPIVEGICYRQLGDISATTGTVEKAIKLYEISIEKLKNKEPLELARSLFSISKIHLNQRKLDNAKIALDQAIKTFANHEIALELEEAYKLKQQYFGK